MGTDTSIKFVNWESANKLINEKGVKYFDIHEGYDVYEENSSLFHSTRSIGKLHFHSFNHTVEFCSAFQDFLFYFLENTHKEFWNKLLTGVISGNWFTDKISELGIITHRYRLIPPDVVNIFCKMFNEINREPINLWLDQYWWGYFDCESSTNVNCKKYFKEEGESWEYSILPSALQVTELVIQGGIIKNSYIKNKNDFWSYLDFFKKVYAEAAKNKMAIFIYTY